jgi:uncharacterized Zn-finger protein
MKKKTETTKVDSRNVACDGGGQLGHPRVFLAIDDTNQATCPYCGKVFVLEGEKVQAGH